MTTYHYYPNTRSVNTNRASAPTFDRMTTSNGARRPSLSPPPLSRASTPDSSAPATPVLSHAFPPSSKQRKPQVGFASSIVTSAYRRPEPDERFVMRAFASHATHCNRCAEPDRVQRMGQTLCRTGTDLAKDIGKYFYCCDGKPYSTIDRNQRSERVQVEVPVEYSVIKTLFEALAKGLGFAPLKQKRPAVHHSASVPAPVRANTEPYELKPSRSDSRRHSANVYPGYAAVPMEGQQYQPAEPRKYETRTPHDERYRGPSAAAPQESRPATKRTHSKRGSLYEPESGKKRNSSYVLPFSSGWLR